LTPPTTYHANGGNRSAAGRTAAQLTAPIEMLEVRHRRGGFPSTGQNSTAAAEVAEPNIAGPNKAAFVRALVLDCVESDVCDCLSVRRPCGRDLSDVPRDRSHATCIQVEDAQASVAAPDKEQTAAIGRPTQTARSHLVVRRWQEPMHSRSIRPNSHQLPALGAWTRNERDPAGIGRPIGITRKARRQNEPLRAIEAEERKRIARASADHKPTRIRRPAWLTKEEVIDVFS
jgi:hypothetical protein